MSERLTDQQLREIARSFTDQSIEAAAVNEALTLRARVAKLEAALDEAEAVLSIVMPRSNAVEYRRVLGVVRAALKDAPNASG
jgi:hypothetical protein